jgi:hypothetical protein
MSSLVLTVDQVAAELEYFHRPAEGQERGAPNSDLVREMYREGDFPPPIDPAQPVTRWRWSRTVVERYVAGEWPWPLAPVLAEMDGAA